MNDSNDQVALMTEILVVTLSIAVNVLKIFFLTRHHETCFDTLSVMMYKSI